MTDLSDNIIIPFGEECYTCQSIDNKFSNNNIRKLGYPFDYVGHTYIEQIYINMVDLLENNYKISISDFNIQNFNNKYYFCHSKYNYKYWHDISGTNNTFEENGINDFIEKYNRRYTRLYDTINNCNNVNILCVNHFDNIYNKILKSDEICKLYDLLYKFNNNIKIISINFGITDQANKNIHFVNLPVNYDLPFAESKEIFTNSLYNYMKNYNFIHNL